MLTPSSNTVLEPYTSAMFAPFGEEASAHFGRFRVVEISMSAVSQDQFRDGPIIEAATRLAEAKVDLIAWNGTSAAWLGLDKDRALCNAITRETGIPATSTMLAYDRLFKAIGLTRIGLVTPYVGEIQMRIIKNLRRQGIEVVAETRLEISDNHAFGTVGRDDVAAMIRSAASAGAEAVAVVCTNFRGAPLAGEIEAETGILILDSVSVTAAHCMTQIGLDPARVTDWGRVFSLFAGLSETALALQPHD